MASTKVNIVATATSETDSHKKAAKDIRSVGDSAQKSKAPLDQMGDSLVRVAAGIQVFSAAMGAAGAAFAKFSERMNAGERLLHLSQITGEAVSGIVELQHALAANGMSAESVSTIFARFAKAIEDAQSPTSEAARAFAALGLRVSDLKALTATEQIKTLQKAISALPTASARATAAMKIFGRAGAERENPKDWKCCCPFRTTAPSPLALG
jgi:hypothetical protein